MPSFFSPYATPLSSMSPPLPCCCWLSDMMYAICEGGLVLEGVFRFGREWSWMSALFIQFRLDIIPQVLINDTGVMKSMTRSRIDRSATDISSRPYLYIDFTPTSCIFSEIYLYLARLLQSSICIVLRTWTWVCNISEPKFISALTYQFY